MPKTGSHRWYAFTGFIQAKALQLYTWICEYAGAMQVTGLEYHHIQDLHALMPAGAKVMPLTANNTDCLLCITLSSDTLLCLLQIAVKDVTVRRGTLLLTPNNTIVLGGQVTSQSQRAKSAASRDLL